MDKTNFMVFRKETQMINPILYMNGSNIDSDENFNFLRLVLSSNPQWICHISAKYFDISV